MSIGRLTTKRLPTLAYLFVTGLQKREGSHRSCLNIPREEKYTFTGIVHSNKMSSLPSSRSIIVRGQVESSFTFFHSSPSNLHLAIIHQLIISKQCLLEKLGSVGMDIGWVCGRWPWSGEWLVHGDHGSGILPHPGWLVLVLGWDWFSHPYRWEVLDFSL